MNLRFLALVSLSACALSAVYAGTAYNSYPGLVDYGWYVGGYAPGVQFESALSGSLTGFDVDITDYAASGAQDFTLTLYADAGGNPGASLGSWNGTTNGTDDVYVAATGASLSAGSYYWLEANDGPVGDFSYYPALQWNWSTSVPDTLWVDPPYYDSSSEAEQSAFSVSVSSAPGPEAIIPFALGLVGVIRRRKSA